LGSISAGNKGSPVHVDAKLKRFLHIEGVTVELEENAWCLQVGRTDVKRRLRNRTNSFLANKL
jgi:hypothetical protein